MKNSKKLKVKTLVDSGCIHMGINKQLVKKKKIQMKPLNFLFEVFNTDRMKNGEVTKMAPLEIKINEHKKTLEAAVTDLDSITNLDRMDMFLGHNWLVKHNLEVNWKNKTIKLIRYPESCIMKDKDIMFKTRRTKTIENTEQNNGEIGKEPDRTNLEDLPEYI